MGRKMEENHRIVEQNSQRTGEDLIKQQNVIENFVLGKGEESQEENVRKEERQENDTSDTMDQREVLQELLGNPIETREGHAGVVGMEESQQKKTFEKKVVLIGATTYLDSGVRYFKNKPAIVTEQKVYEQLLKTGLFVRI